MRKRSGEAYERSEGSCKSSRVQAFPLLHSVQFVIADEQSFEQEKSGTADITLAKYVPHSTLIVHTSFENGVIFEVTKDSGIHCPDRVVVSTELFRPVKTEIKGGKRVPITHTDGNLEHSEGVDPDVLMQYRMYILGFIEGCWAGK